MTTNPSNSIPSEPAQLPSLTPRKINWLVFFAVLLGPVVVTIAAVLLGADGGDATPTIAFLGGGISGIVCGALLGQRLGRTPAMKVALGILFSFVFGAVCIGMCCFGCLASGYKLNF